MANSPEKSKNLGYQERKFQISLANTPHLRFPRAFLDAIHLFSSPEFRALVKLWDWFQSPEVRDPEKFSIGRAKLAQLAGVGERQAYGCLKKLERLEFILVIPAKDGRRTAGSYMWNWGNIRGTLYPRGTAVVPQGSNTLYPRGTAVAPNGYNLYITSLLILLNPSYSIAFGASLMGNHKEALRAGILDGKGAALAAAVEHLWQRTAAKGGWPLHDIHAAILHLIQSEIDLIQKDDVASYLFTVLKDGEAVHLFRKKNPTHFKNEDELISQLEQHNQALALGGNEHDQANA